MKSEFDARLSFSYLKNRENSLEKFLIFEKSKLKSDFQDKIIACIHEDKARLSTMITNNNFLISISLKTDVVDLWYFKLWIIMGQIV